MPRDPGLDDLLLLDGVTLVVDPLTNYWGKFVVKHVKSSHERPHGLSYSLTLHDVNGERLVGFDNAHPVPGAGRHASRTVMHDHQHGQGPPRP